MATSSARILFRRFISSKYLSADEQTIICYHPRQTPDIAESKPVKTVKKPCLEQRSYLQQEEIEIVKQLRGEDSSVWSINTLASLFNVKRSYITRIAPANKERQIQLDEDRQAIQNLPLRQKRTILARRETARKNKLQNYLQTLNYDFPGLKNIP